MRCLLLICLLVCCSLSVKAQPVRSNPGTIDPAGRVAVDHLNMLRSLSDRQQEGLRPPDEGQPLNEPMIGMLQERFLYEHLDLPDTVKHYFLNNGIPMPVLKVTFDMNEGGQASNGHLTEAFYFADSSEQQEGTRYSELTVNTPNGSMVQRIAIIDLPSEMKKAINKELRRIVNAMPNWRTRRQKGLFTPVHVYRYLMLVLV